MGLPVREGVDFSARRPSAAALGALGIDFVVRYARCFTHPKCITADEVKYWRDNGIDIAIVEESSAERALAGAAAGRADALAACARIVSIGGPADGGVIYLAVDFQPTDAQMPAVLSYLAGAASVRGSYRTGVYGSYKVVDAAVRAGVVNYFWQTYAWSHSLRHPRAQLYQWQNSVTIDGVEVDLNHAYAADFGQWSIERTDDMAGYSLADDERGLAWLRDVLGAGGGKSVTGVTERSYNDLHADVTDVGARVDRVETALSALTTALDTSIGEVIRQLQNVAAGDVNEQALAQALAPLVGTEVADTLTARLAS